MYPFCLRIAKGAFITLVKILGELDKPIGKTLNSYKCPFQKNFRNFLCSAATGIV
jgi:hypothetical protein